MSCEPNYRENIEHSIEKLNDLSRKNEIALKEYINIREKLNLVHLVYFL